MVNGVIAFYGQQLLAIEYTRMSLLCTSDELLNAKSFEVKSNTTEESCGSCAEFQPLAVKCQLSFLAKPKLQKSGGIKESLKDKAVYSQS